ncbi:MAG: GvpL/GvpF family gas vesicle protein [Gemmatimonadaceae bacterium]|nr:GvpL/GvpF family gas vesicle protein [Gemmatimonadaceae bacterium]
MDSVCYVYGVVPSTFVAASDPKGLDGLTVNRVTEGDLTALVSSLSPGEYSPERLEANTALVEWLGPRAVAHDRVVTWAGDASPVIPFPMWTLFMSEEGIRKMLRERAAEFRETLTSVSGTHEYAVRIFASPVQVQEQIARLRPAIADLEAAAAKATPGQRYLLQKKIAEQREGEVRAFLRETAQDCYDQLERASVKAVRHQLPTETPAGKGRAILYAAFLVGDPALDEFRRVLTSLVTQHRDSGLDFDFTGPWPPYNFVGTRSGG